jgi:hypothetical protein
MANEPKTGGVGALVQLPFRMAGRAPLAVWPATDKEGTMIETRAPMRPRISR